jgi:hypothetical protein
MAGTDDIIIDSIGAARRQHACFSNTSSVAERRLEIARTLYQALVAQDPDRVITGGGGVVAQHDPPPEQSSDTLVTRSG